MPIENRIAMIIFLAFVAGLFITCVTRDILAWWRLRGASESADNSKASKQSANRQVSPAQVQVQLTQNVSVVLKPDSK